MMNALSRFMLTRRPLLTVSFWLLAGAGFLHADSAAHLLGPTGMFGVTRDKSIKVSKVEKGSPADGKVKAGDWILGANGAQFSGDPRRELATAINESEGSAMAGRLVLQLKGGKQVELQLKAYGDFSDTAPQDCAKTNALVTAAADQLIADEKALERDKLAIGWLGLMATGEDKYLDVVKAKLPEQDWANPDRAQLMGILNGDPSGYVGWYWGYSLIALSEYHLLTGDQSVLPAIEAYALALSKGQDAAGIWGHRMTSPTRDGRLPGYAHINQPSLSCFIGLVLARTCGVDAPELDAAIGKCQAFYNTFTGKGTIPYGVHDPNDGEFNNNGMSGSSAMAMTLLNDQKAAKFFSRQVATDYDRLESGHASYFFNVLWSPLGANVAGPEVTKSYHKKSRWLYTLYRSWDGSFTYDGDTHKGLSPTGALLLNYCTPRKQLYITGKNADQTLWAKGAEVEAIMNLSKIDYASLSDDGLLDLFGHEAPQVRRRAVWTLRERDGKFLGRIDQMVIEGNDLQQDSALSFLGYRCPPEWALPRLDLIGSVLKDQNEDPEVRAAAAYALCWYKPQGQAYFTDMLRFLLEDKPTDGFGLIDKKVGAALSAISGDPFKDGLVKDKPLFYKAVDKLAANPRQGARSYAMNLLQGMPAEDFPVVADMVKHVVLNRDPSYHSYHNPQLSLLPGGKLLARLGIKEGPEWALQVMRTNDGKGSFKARATVGVLKAYGANSKTVVEEIQADPQLLRTLSGGRWAKDWKATMRAISSGKPAKPLVPFEEAKKGGLR